MRDIDFSKVKRISIVGTSSTGKTSLGKTLSDRLNFPHTDLDEVFWLPNWTKRDVDEGEKEIEEFVKNQAWIISGNYSTTSEKYIWPNADLIVWLDYPFSLIISRVLKRSFQRITKKIPICQGNYETWKLFFSKHSIIGWILRSYRRRKKKYGELYTELGPHMMLRLRSQKETDEFLKILLKRR